MANIQGEQEEGLSGIEEFDDDLRTGGSLKAEGINGAFRRYYGALRLG